MNNLKSFFNFILIALLIVIVGTFLNETLEIASQKQMVGMCLTHNQHDKEFPQYWVSESDAEACKDAGVELTARVKTNEELQQEEAEFQQWKESKQ